MLFEARHYQRMGAAVWLYGWLVLRQTHQQGEIGWVLGGSPISYREIEEETGFNCRTLERWMRTLRRHGYIETEAVPAGVIVRITKAKKFPQATRSSADSLRKGAGGAPQVRVANASDLPLNQHAAGRIGSSSVERLKERPTPPIFHNDFQSQTEGCDGKRAPTNPSCLGTNRGERPQAGHDSSGAPHYQEQRKFFAEARLRLQLLRAEREEAVRRELAVGTGPEVQR